MNQDYKNLSRRNFFKFFASVFFVSFSRLLNSNASGLFTSSFWKKRAVAPWLTLNYSHDYFGSGGASLDSSHYGIGSRVCRLGNGSIAMMGGVAFEDNLIKAYVSKSANGAFDVTGVYHIPTANDDRLGDQLEVECVKSVLNDHYYVVWQSSSGTDWGIHAAKLLYNNTATGAAAYSAYSIGDHAANMTMNTGPAVAIVNSEDKLLIPYLASSTMRWFLRSSTLAAVVTGVTHASVPTNLQPIAGFSIGTDFYVWAASTTVGGEPYMIKINTSGTNVSRTGFNFSADKTPESFTRGEALVINATNVILLWISNGKVIFSRFNPSTLTFLIQPFIISAFPSVVLIGPSKAIAAAINASYEIIINYGQSFIMLDSEGVTLKPMITVSSILFGSGGVTFRLDENRIVVVETKGTNPVSGLIAYEFSIT